MSKAKVSSPAAPAASATEIRDALDQFVRNQLQTLVDNNPNKTLEIVDYKQNRYGMDDYRQLPAGLQVHTISAGHDWKAKTMADYELLGLYGSTTSAGDDYIQDCQRQIDLQKPQVLVFRPITGNSNGFVTDRCLKFFRGLQIPTIFTADAPLEGGQEILPGYYGQLVTPVLPEATGTTEAQA